MRTCTAIWTAGILAIAVGGRAEPPHGNLLLNPDFGFHATANSRTGKPTAYASGSIPGWNQDAYGDVEVRRATRQTDVHTAFPVDGLAVLRPGKRLYQFALLAELGLDHGDRVSLRAFGRQTTPDALEVRLHLTRIDSQSGNWTPKSDGRTFPKHARGELIRDPTYAARSGAKNDFDVALENREIVGAFTESPDASTDQPNTIGLEVEFVNRSTSDVWIYGPCLCRGAQAQSRLSAARPVPTYYRGIPRTIQKLWRGEPLHIIVMGSSIDRGSANPPMYLYDEDPRSATFKEPLSGRDFEGEKIGRPEWNDYIGWWQHYFMYGGRLRRLLMEKFDYPLDKLLLNTMACDGSSISEAHSGLAEYASLALPPDPHGNGHRAGKTWRELYPALFARPEGPRPDLVIFGSGANEKVDGADEIALFEGAIRWFQRRYPCTEFLFCMWQNRESYTPNTAHLMELSLRYQIPYIDLGRTLSLTTRYCNSYALCPRDGHPQAAGHFLWAKQLERAFDAADPIESGVAQLQLPERVHPNTLVWEGEISTYAAPHARIRNGTALVLDETMVNLWAASKDAAVGVRIDGVDVEEGRRRPSSRRDLRNSTFVIGRLALGNRHIVEVTSKESRLVAADCKTALGRQWFGVEQPAWKLGPLKPQPFESAWGAPYGSSLVIVPPGKSVEAELPGTRLSAAYLDRPDGGTMQVEVDGQAVLEQPTNEPFTLASGEKTFLENRRAVGGLTPAVHRVRITASQGPVAILGVFTYDERSWRP